MENGLFEIKIVLIGDTGVGKSSIMLRYVADNFKEDSDSTIGTSYMGKIVSVKDSMVKVNIWDTAGQERYHSLAKMYYKDADAAILVYDITNSESYYGMLNWYEEIKENGGQDITIAIAGNKEDCFEHETVSSEEVNEFADQIAAFYIKTSAKSNIGIEQLFKCIIEKVYRINHKSLSSRKSFSVTKTNKNKKGSCCT